MEGDGHTRAEAPAVGDEVDDDCVIVEAPPGRRRARAPPPRDEGGASGTAAGPAPRSGGDPRKRRRPIDDDDECTIVEHRRAPQVPHPQPAHYGGASGAAARPPRSGGDQRRRRRPIDDDECIIVGHQRAPQVPQPQPAHYGGAAAGMPVPGVADYAPGGIDYEAAYALHLLDNPLPTLTEELRDAGSMVSVVVASSEGEGGQCCSVCLDDLVANESVRTINRCQHMYHTGCLDKWFRSSVFCPVCKWDLREAA